MKMFAISDLHLSINNPKPMNIFGNVWDNQMEKIERSWNENVTENDVVLISGDISWAMTLENSIVDLDYICGFKGHKILIRGNHDYWWKSISNVRANLKNNTFALQNDCVRLGSFLVAGSRGWTTPEKKHDTAEDEKIYKRELLRMEMSLQAMEKLRQDGDRAVVMIHYPPFNSRMEGSEFTALFDKYAVDSVVYGHLHGKLYKKQLYYEINNVKYYLTSCDQVDNELVRIY